jgi:hypothetical protein
MMIPLCFVILFAVAIPCILGYAWHKRALQLEAANERLWKEVDDLADQRRALHRQLFKLHFAAATIYDAGHWTCDRDVHEAALWERLRDALGRKPGTAPKAVR